MSVNFTIPKGYSAPEGVKEGEEFSDIVTFKFEGDKMMILNVGEDKAPIESREEKKEKPKGAKSAIKEQLSSLEDKKGSAKMEDSGSEDMDD